MSELRFCQIPLVVNQLNIASAYELQILALAASLPSGLKQSNNQLAELFFVNRRTVIRAVNALKLAGHIRNTGTEHHRILVASEQVKALFNSPANGDNPVTHNIISKVNKDNIYGSEISKIFEEWGKKPGKYDRDTAETYLATKGLAWCLRAIRQNSQELYLGAALKKGDSANELESVFGLYGNSAGD